MSEKIYALLWRLYPANFRKSYGEEALQLFRDRARDEKGFISGLQLWLDLLRDLAISVPREYRSLSAAPALTQAQYLHDGTPSFHTLEAETLSTHSLLFGGIASLTIYSFLFFMIGRAGNLLHLPPVLAQTVTSAAPALGADSKPLAFEVISIREDKSEPNPQAQEQIGPTPDGLRLKGVPVFGLLQMAYLPSEGGMAFRPSRIMGVPAWASYSPGSIRYDIDARVSQADLSRWKDPAQQPAMLRTMLQAMLADRFKLAVHREGKELPIYEMSLGKKAPKFKPSQATTPAEIRQKYPRAVMLTNGTFVVPGPNPGQQTLFGITMPDLGTFLSNTAGRPIQDKTGLTGRYDITYQIELRPPPQDDGSPAPIPPDFFNSQIMNIVQDQLGLQLKPAKGSVETLVIDHVEQPSEN